MREFVLRGDSYFLNGRKTYVKAGFWEGLYPDTLAFPQNAEVVRREIRLAKEAGFNVLRPWRKPPVPMILDLADEMGIMMIGAPPIECMNYWPQLAPETEQRIATEVREMVLRDRNHPSLVYWELFNEVVRPGLGRLKHTMSLLARELDPTRIVMDESGGWADGAHVYPPHGYEAEPINEIHSYLPSPVDARTYNFYLRLGRPGFDAKMLGRSQMRAPDGLFFVSEVGYGGLPDLPANVAQYKAKGNPLTPDYRYTVRLLEGIEKAMREMKWGDIFPDAGALCRASQRVQAEGNRLQLEALRLNPRVGGYCLHAYTDGDWVVGAGVLDLFRETKLTYHTVKRVQAPALSRPPGRSAERARRAGCAAYHPVGQRAGHTSRPAAMGDRGARRPDCPPRPERRLRCRRHLHHPRKPTASVDAIGNSQSAGPAAHGSRRGLRKRARVLPSPEGRPRAAAKAVRRARPRRRARRLSQRAPDSVRGVYRQGESAGRRYGGSAPRRRHLTQIRGVDGLRAARRRRCFPAAAGCASAPGRRRSGEDSRAVPPATAPAPRARQLGAR